MKLTVSYQYSSEQLKILHDFAKENDVDNGGVYDTGSGAIKVWTHPWHTAALRSESTLVCVFYLNWVASTLWKIECEEGFSVDDALKELGKLERQAMNCIIYGDV